MAALMRDHFEYSRETGKSKRPVVESGCEICGVLLIGKRTYQSKSPLTKLTLKEKQNVRQVEGAGGNIRPTTKQLLVSKHTVINTQEGHKWEDALLNTLRQ